jgi:hypothetical protein
VEKDREPVNCEAWERSGEWLESLATGGARSDVVAKLDKPSASQAEGAAREDVWAFYPDGVKFTFSSRKFEPTFGWPL